MPMPFLKAFASPASTAASSETRSKHDLSLVVSDRPAVAAGVYTQNLVFAAPVALDRARTPAADIRAVVINSGNANACTGERGTARRRAKWPRLAAEACGARSRAGPGAVDRHHRRVPADGQDRCRASAAAAEQLAARRRRRWSPPPAAC